MTSVVWFKRDLRLHDHAPLLRAARRGPLVALHITEPSLWDRAVSSLKRDAANEIRSQC